MTVIFVCENCGANFDYELVPTETIICPKCKTVYNSIMVINDEENRKELERFQRMHYDRKTELD